MSATFLTTCTFTVPVPLLSFIQIIYILYFIYIITTRYVLCLSSYKTT